MASHVLDQARRPIVVMRAYLLLLLVAIVAGLSADRKVQDGTISSRGIVALCVGLLLLVLFNLALYRRHRWAWYLAVLVYVFAVVSILWEHVKPLPYAYNIVAVALLLSPPMRQYINHGRGNTVEAGA